MATALQFETYAPQNPDMDTLRETYDTLISQLEQAESAAKQLEIISQWNTHSAKFQSWSSMANLKFRQDTTDADALKARELSDELSPQVQEQEVRIKRAILSSPWRPELEDALGSHAFTIWEMDLTSYDPRIEEQEIELNKLSARYTELRSEAKIEFDGKKYNISQMGAFFTSADRDVRHRANKARWEWVASISEELDSIFDRMVALRHEEAQLLGFESYVELGYQRMHRLDYDRHDVETFREEVRRVVVPIAQKLVQAQRERLGIQDIKAWDLGVHDLNGNPTPDGDHDWMVERATEMFDDMGHQLGEFFRLMKDQNFMDLKARDNKAGGGFCTGFPEIEMPFVFANFNDTKHDVEVFTHEIGHAFQYWLSQRHELLDYRWPTHESAEIHSMSLEFLTWPYMEKFFGEDAERFRTVHLSEGLMFLPYGVAVDHFQHMIYDNPTATPAQRKEMWREVEQMYMPWVDWGDLDYPAQGGRWQLQIHIYAMPFYYIDYTLAQACAMQFWLRAEEDRDEAMEAYADLCDLGGSAPFLALVESANLASPFEPGCLEGVAERVRAQLF